MTKHTLLQGDAVKQLSEYEAGFVDAIVTSPPYNLGIKYDSSVDDTMTRPDYLSKFTPAWLAEARRVLKDDGHFFLNLGAAPANPLLPYQVLLLATEMGWHLQNTIHWIKSITFEDKKGDKVTRGHFKPINSPRYLNDAHEFIFHLTKDGCRPVHRKAEGVGVPYSDPSNIQRWGHTQGENLRCGGNNWLIPTSMGDQDGRWLALLVDAEGSICVNMGSNSSGRSPQHNPVVSVTNTNLELLGVANAIAGGAGVIREKGAPSDSAPVQGKRLCHVLTFTGDAALSVIARIRPWLLVKHRQAQIALRIGWLKKNREAPTRRLTDEELSERDELCERWKALNAGQDVDISDIPEEAVVTLCGGNTWQIPYETINSTTLQRPHPATFPVELAARCLRLAGNPKVVLDPFVGIGTTMVAAAQCEAEWAIGIDLSPSYAVEAGHRLNTKVHYA